LPSESEKMKKTKTTKNRELTPEELEKYPLILTPQDVANIAKLLGLPEGLELTQP